MDFNTPVGRLVQGSMSMQHQKDMDTGQPLMENGQPVMGVFFALAFPKVLPNGQPNTEFDQFFGTLREVAAASWPALFPQGAAGACTHPQFSWKYQDGDGVNKQGKSVADKAGFKGHHIIKFYTAYPVRCFNEGHFAAHEELQDVDNVIKRGYWLRVFGEAKSNNASGNQVPGISLYPKLVSFVERGEEIASGPDAQQALGGAAVGWKPAPVAGSPIPTPGGVPGGVNVPLPTPPAVNVPLPGAVNVPAVNVPLPTPPVVNVPAPPPAAPQYAISPALAAQNITIDMLLAKGWTMDALVQQGHAIKQ
jgi:hypothetical protein